MSEEAGILDIELCSKLARLIETLCNSGLKVLDEATFKEVKKICKSSPGYVVKAYGLILQLLKKNHSEVRLSAFQICIELFNKSHAFRELFLKDIRLIFKLTAEIDSKKTLPPPKAAASALKALAISTIQKWANNFGDTYKQLQVAYHYFKKCRRIDFEALEAQNSAEQLLTLQKEKQMAKISEEKMKKLEKDLKDNESEIESAITALSNCISLLLPPPENFFVVDDNEKQDQNEGYKSESNVVSNNDGMDHGSSSVDLREHGVNPYFGLSVNLNLSNEVSIKKTSENISIIENAEDIVRQISHRFLPTVKRWSQICTKHSTSDMDTFKRIMSLKTHLEKVAEQYRKLNVEVRKHNDDESNTSDDDFEEVTKEGYEDSVKEVEYLTPLTKQEPLVAKVTPINWGISLGEDESDPTTALPTLNQLKGPAGNVTSTSMVDEQQPSTSKKCLKTTTESASASVDRKTKLLAAAPKLPFDIDLYHWEDENLKAPTLLSVKLDNPKFWGTTAVDDMDEIPNPDGVAALRTRVIEFSGSFEPVKWSCRAPLGNNKFCPRKDRVKCPFHGKIVARDEFGKCKNPEDEEYLKKAQKQEEVPDWQDPQLLEELKKATGIDLKMPNKKKKRKKGLEANESYKKIKTSTAALREVEKRNFPGITDVISRRNNCYKRLSKKIFNRSSLNRVASAINKLEHKKFRDKFGDQFNYVYDTS